LLLLGIPITGSEVVLYSLLVDAGWSPFQFNNIPANIQLIFQQMVPWFVFVNVMALLIAWPFAKYILSILRFNRTMMMIVLGLIVVVTNTYMGYLDYRTMAYTVYLVVFSVLGLALRRYELVPAIFMFILGGSIEAVYYRQFLL
jgi:hypothetical protein